MSHLRDEITALVDGRLAPEETEAALEHVVACEECATVLAAERAFRRRLSEARDVLPSEDLTARLMELGSGPVPPAPRGARALVGRAWEPLTYGPVRRRAAARGSLVLAGAASVLGVLVLVGALYERTGDPVTMLNEVDGPAESPLQVMATADAVASADEADSTEAALAWLRQNGWVAPEHVPDGASISLVGSVGSLHPADPEQPVGAQDDEVIVVDFRQDGRTATVVQQRGVLEVADLAGLEEVDLGENEVHQLPGSSATVVLQSAGTTVLVTSDNSPELVRAIAAGMPASQPGPGVGDRIDRGWQTLVGWTDLLLQPQ
ncbi:hypothetical protein GCM10023169_12960 [Georgenia halophila]|uniref:Zinc-finger domain-containing protein n=1 Tax=Georgenia halophila TaxID=620889 RepID=A0ABP8L315_9MICO